MQQSKKKINDLLGAHFKKAFTVENTQLAGLLGKPKEEKDQEWVDGLPAQFDPFSDAFDTKNPANVVGMGMNQGISEEDMNELINPKFEDMNEKFDKLCSSLQKQVDSLLSKYEDSTSKHSQSIL